MESLKIEVKELNKMLSNLFDGRLITVATEESDGWGESKDQGSMGTQTIVYATTNPELFIKVDRADDSYGSKMGITSVKFVQPTIKTVTAYQEI